MMEIRLLLKHLYLSNSGVEMSFKKQRSRISVRRTQPDWALL